MKQKRSASCLNVFLISAAALAGLCLLLAGISVVINQAEGQPVISDHLTEADKANLEEIIHLRQTVGEQVIPGWGQADIPIILYNEDYAFLVGYADPPDGWIKVPQGIQRGVAWEPVANDDFQGQVYYRQPLRDDITPEAFTVQIGDRWAASLNTRDSMKRALAAIWRDELPGPLRAVFPYKLAVNLFLGGSDQYASVVLHEAAHAYQGIRAANRLNAAEQVNADLSERYPVEDEAFQAGWEKELEFLLQGLTAKTVDETRAAAQNFLKQREQRRKDSNLSADLIKYERCREWVEGIGRYAEIEVYRRAASPDYSPSPAIMAEDQFNSYRGYKRRWDNEIGMIRGLADDYGDGRFYGTGLAQAVMLDRLMPNWKDRLFEEDVWLEDLLAIAVR